jgi:hypothetical protein
MTTTEPRHGTRQGYLYDGCRCASCTAANTREHKLYLLGRKPKLIDPTGSRRRIHALLALGWTYGEISTACNRTSRNWACYVATSEGRIRSDVAAVIAAAYEWMSTTIPDGPYRDRGRSIAAAKGWHLPEAWDDIDDPHEAPYEGEQPPPERGPGRRQTFHERVEDAEWMADTDETLTGACARMRITPDGLNRACKKAGRLDVYDRLASRELTGHMSERVRASKRTDAA